MEYDKQIIQILADVGQQGIGVQQLAKHVYNMSSTLFYQPDLGEVYAYVRNFIRRNSRNRRSLVERTGRWGYYRLNIRGSQQARQLLQQLRRAADKEAAEEDDKPERPPCDLELSLF